MARKQTLANIWARAGRHSETAAKAVMFMAAGVMLLAPAPLFAGEYEHQIETAETVIRSYKQQQTRLAKLAKKLEKRLDNLDKQIAAIKQQIKQNKQKYQRISQKLEKLQARVAQQSDQLEWLLRQSYFSSQMSVIEMIASRESLSHYMDYYEAQDRLQSHMLAQLGDLKAAKEQVAAQRARIKRVLLEGKTMKQALQHKRQQVQDLLERTRGQQRLYEQLIKQRNAHIAKLRAKQKSANLHYFAAGKLIPGDPNNGGYPDRLNNAPQDSLVDPWGMYNRECVSYTAWKVYQTTGHMPYWGGHGNAEQWPASARRAGIPVGSTPKEGAVAIAFIGPYGHAMFVEEVLPNGKIHISEYNYFVDGTYTERIISGDGLTYIYFQQAEWAKEQ